MKPFTHFPRRTPYGQCWLPAGWPAIEEFSIRSREGRGAIAPAEDRCLPAIVEPLEPRRHLTGTFTASMYAHPAGSLSSYTVNLFTTGYKAVKWVIYWNDGDSGAQGHNPITYTNSNGYNNPTAFTYAYSMAPTTPIKAVATAANGATATAYFALSDVFGSHPAQHSGESLANPYNYTSTLSQDSMAVDTNADTSDTFRGYSYVATAYKVGAGSTEFGISQFDATGNLNPNWGANGTLGISFDSGSDVPYGISISGDGANLVVVGKCSTGWAVALVNTALNPNTHTYGQVPWQSGANFEAGQLNAVSIDRSTDPDVVVAGTDGSGNMAAAKFALATDGSELTTDWGPTSYTTGNSGTTSQATCVISDIGIDDTIVGANGPDEFAPGGNRANEVVVLGGTTSYTGGSDMTLVAVHELDGTVDTAWGNVAGHQGVERDNIALTIGCGASASYDSEAALVTWYDGTNYTVTAVGTSTYNPSCEFALIQYRVTANVNDDAVAAIDTSFGSDIHNRNGVSLGTGGNAHAAFQDPATGKIIVAGTDTNFADFVTERFNHDGTVDTTFGNQGVFQNDFGDSSSNTSDQAWGVALETDGSILVCGTSTSASGHIALADYLSSNLVTLT